MFVYRAIGLAVFVDAERNEERRLNRRRIVAKRIKRSDSVSEQFQHSSGGSQSCGPKMDRQQRPVQKPRWNCGGTDQHARVSREQSSEDRRTKNEDAGDDAQELIECARKDLMRVQFECDQTWNCACAERAENPGTHGHCRSVFENAQHVEEEMGAAQIHDQKNRRKNRPSYARDPHGCARKIEMMKDN